MDGRWSLVTYLVGDAREEHVGMLTADGMVRSVPQLSDYDGVSSAMRDWTELSDLLELLVPSDHEPVPQARILAPLRYPRKVLCAGANYWGHLREMAGDAPIAGGDGDADRPVPDPYFFLLPASTIVGPSDPVEIPVDGQAKVDWEGELAVVIGRTARNVPAAEAPSVIAGYTVCNDISARGLHRRAVYLAPPFEWDWLRSKARDTFLPMGPGLTPAWFVDDPHDLRLRLWVNDVLKQDAYTSDLIVDVWQLVAAASALFTLEPGDVIATGTPAGVGAAHSEFLKPGDLVTVEVEGLGRLTNPVRADADLVGDDVKPSAEASAAER